MAIEYIEKKVRPGEIELIFKDKDFFVIDSVTLTREDLLEALGKEPDRIEGAGYASESR